MIGIGPAAVGRVHFYAGGKEVAQQQADGTFAWLHTDHLGTPRKMTNAAGVVIFRGEYDPHGNPLYEWSASGNTGANNRKFTGYERDTGAGLDYAQARHYSYGRGRFTQPDPIGLRGANTNFPQSLNLYAYAANDPINKYDPTGLLTLIIPGTVSDGDWGQPGTEFWTSVRDTFGEEPLLFDWWSGLISTVFGITMHRAASDLADFINGRIQLGEKLNIVAHSHGGNLVKAYTQRGDAKTIDVFIGLAVPQRADFEINMGKVKNYFNVYTKWDAIQKIGALPFPTGNSRTDDCAINIGVDNAVGRNPFTVHSQLHTTRVWNEMLGWLQRARLSVFTPGANGFMNRNSQCGRLTGSGSLPPIILYPPILNGAELAL